MDDDVFGEFEKEENNTGTSKENVSYIFEVSLGEALYAEAPSDGIWYRIFEVPGEINLLQFHKISIEVLRWGIYFYWEPFVFTIGDVDYAEIGSEEPLIIDNFSNRKLLSCEVFLSNILIKEKTNIIFTYKLGSYSVFRHGIFPEIELICLGISQHCTNEHLPRIIRFRGYDLCPYTNTFDKNHWADTTLPKKIDYFYRADTCRKPLDKVRFVLKEDAATLRGWRIKDDRRRWERAVVILENRNLTVAQIATKIERPHSRIREWIYSFNCFGIEGLKRTLDNRRLGIRESTKSKSDKIIEILHDRPISYDVNRSSWNREGIATAYKEKFGEEISVATVSRLVKIAGYGWRKSRRVLTSSDPQYQEKIQAILEALHSLKSSELFFFIDEMGPILIRKQSGRSYLKKNETNLISRNQITKGVLTFTGALSATTNQMTWLYGKNKNTTGMIEIIELLFNKHYDKNRLIITWDAASWHRSIELTTWLDGFNATTKIQKFGPIIELIPLPNCSQFLNVIEAVFSAMKRAIIHNSDYQSAKEMKTAISRHFAERNDFFAKNPKRAGKKIWDIDFFRDYAKLTCGSYREW
ncbi:MAG: IS630 family transposase [Bacteroidales bacterium]|nr:IS630 family transposase [Bacteroidales bacterium]